MGRIGGFRADSRHTAGVMMARRLIAGVVMMASLTWLSAIVTAATVLHAGEHDVRWRAAAAAYVAGAFVCHQRPDRSFHTAGVQWPVCARCTGLYAGGALGLVAWPLWRRAAGDSRRQPSGDRRRQRAITMAVAAPTLLTVATGTLGLFDPPNAWRAALALPLGTLAGGLLTAVLLGDLR